VPANREIASGFKSQIGVLYVCEGPSDPAVLQGVRFFGEATFTHPYDVIHSFKYLHVHLLSVWAFNKRSGAVLKKGDD